MSPARRKPAPPPVQPTPRDEFEREMLEAARMLGQLMAEALLSCYRTFKARRAMEEAETRALQEAHDRAQSSVPVVAVPVAADPTPIPRVPTSAMLTIDEASVVLGISRSSLYQLIARGDIPVLRMGKSVRIVPAQLEEWIRERSTKPLLERRDFSMFGPKPRKAPQRIS